MYDFEKKIEIENFKKENQIKNQKIIKDHLFLSNDFISYDIDIKNLNIINIFYNNKYLGNLPYNLNFNLNGLQILSKFGEPDEKLGGKYTYISVVYYRLGIEIKFDINHWNDPNAKIKFIVEFKPDISKIKCGLCLKKGNLLCNKCKLIYYCNQICLENHSKYHKLICK